MVAPLAGSSWFDRRSPYRRARVSCGVACARALGLGAAVGPRLGGSPTALLLPGFVAAAPGAAVRIPAH